jgi:hypothetical protein
MAGALSQHGLVKDYTPQNTSDLGLGIPLEFSLSSPSAFEIADGSRTIHAPDFTWFTRSVLVLPVEPTGCHRRSTMFSSRWSRTMAYACALKAVGFTAMELVRTTKIVSTLDSVYKRSNELLPPFCTRVVPKTGSTVALAQTLDCREIVCTDSQMLHRSRPLFVACSYLLQTSWLTYKKITKILTNIAFTAHI